MEFAPDIKVHPLAGAAVTVKARLLLQVKFTWVVTVPRTGPGEADGSIILKAMLPVEPPTKAHRASATPAVPSVNDKKHNEMRYFILTCFDRIAFIHYSKKRSLLQASSTGI
jgi:hypothetical protein